MDVNMKEIYYELYYKQSEDTDETDEIDIFLGVFSSAKLAREAIDFLCKHPDFKYFQKKNFIWEKVKLDRYWWKEGFITVKEAMKYQKRVKL